MALQIIFFFILAAISIGLFLFGGSRETVNTGFIFLALSAVIAIVTGLFMLNGGIQLDSVKQITGLSDPNTVTYIYDTLTAEKSTPVWVVGNIFMYGGVLLMIISIGLAFRERRQVQDELAADSY